MKKSIVILSIICIAAISAQTTSGCPSYMYSYVAGKICDLCHVTCLTCKGPDYSDCLSCEDGAEPVDGNCLNKY